LLVIIWHVLATSRPHTDLGTDFYKRRTDPEKKPAGSSPGLKPSAIRSASHPLPNLLLTTNPASLRSAGCRHLPRLVPVSYQRQARQRYRRPARPLRGARHASSG